jgi:hypothetical protein
VFDACRIFGAVQSEEGTVVHSMKAATAVYNLIDDTTLFPSADHEMEPLNQEGEKVMGKGIKSGDIRPSQGTLPSQSSLPSQGVTPSQGTAPLTEFASPSIRGSINPQLVEQYLHSNRIAPPESPSEKKEGTNEMPLSEKDFVYDEWDCEADDYRPGYCHIMEKELPSEGKGELFAEEVITEYGGVIKSLKRGFQFLAPEESVWITGEVEGEQFDFNRLFDSRAEANISIRLSD